jgi:general secretion pathway protein K
LFVLWAGALLTVLAAAVAFEARTEVDLASNLVARAEAEVLAEGGIRRGIAGLLSRDRDTRWQADGRIYPIALAAGAIRVRIFAENGKIDVNAAKEALLAGLFAAAAEGIDEEIDPLTLAQRLLDWRDADHRKRPDGAEDGDYAAAGRPHGARDAPLVTLSEVRLLPGVSGALYERFREAATIHTRSATVDPVFAPELVLRALPGVDPEGVVEFLDARTLAIEEAGDGPVGRLPVELLAGGQFFNDTATTEIYTVAAEARTPGGVVARRGALVRVTGNAKNPFTVLEWREFLRPDVFPAGSASGEPEQRGEGTS